MTIEESLDHFKNYLHIRIDIICGKPDYWSKRYNKNKLPSFEYYLQNCVIDKGCNYDFTVRRYSTHTEVILPIESSTKNFLKDSQRKIYSTVKYSYWMGTPFNYKQEIEII
jgi:hypothetical protein